MPGESVPQGLWLPPRAATLVVAASDALDRTRAQADYICDGVADDVEINAALNALPAAGGRVMLSEGTFTLADPIVFPDNNIWLRGMGRSTLIDGNALTTTNHAIELTSRTGCAIKKLAIQTEAGGGKNSHCIFVDDGCDNLAIHDVTIVNGDSDGIHIEGSDHLDIHIRGLRVNDIDDNGISVDMDAAFCDRLLINGCIILGAGLMGIHLLECRYAEITNNVVALSTQSGIVLDDACIYCNLSNNISVLNTQHGILLTTTATHCEVEGCVASLNVRHGIFLNGVFDSLISNCLCQGNDSGDTGTYDGVHLDTTSERNNVIGNHCCDNDRYGIAVEDKQNNVVGNFVYNNNQHGIYISGAECKITGNYVTDNSVDVAGTYHGIVLAATADRCQVNNNYCSDTGGDTQGNGIHLIAGADDCQINDNYCYNSYGGGASSGSGIYLTDNDNCQLKCNYCKDNDGYGIEIVAGSANTVENNKLVGNVTGQISDGGTDTALPFIYEPVHNPNTQIGDHPAVQLTDGLEVSDYFSLFVPAEFQELVRIHVLVVPGGTGNMIYDVATDYGKVCASEDYNTHGAAVVDQVHACTINDIECADLIPAATLANLAASDLVGIKFTRDGASGSDTIDAHCYLIGLRLQYV